MNARLLSLNMQSVTFTDSFQCTVYVAPVFILFYNNTYEALSIHDLNVLFIGLLQKAKRMPIKVLRYIFVEYIHNSLWDFVYDGQGLGSDKS